MRDTLVTADIKEATSIAFNQGNSYRVVTLKGELIEVSGIMSGGGNKPKQGLMGTKIVEEFSED